MPTATQTSNLPLEIDLSAINMAILWNHSQEVDLYFANMAVQTLSLQDQPSLLAALHAKGVTVVEMD